MQDTGGITNPTGIHGHGDDLLFDLRRLPWVAIVQEKGTTGTGLLAAAVPLLTLPSLAMTDNIGSLAVGTIEFISIKPLAATGSGAPGSCARHSRVPSPDRAHPAST